MQTNNLLDLLTSLSKVASTLKESKTASANSFSNEKTKPQVEKTDRQKPPKPKTDAIIKMLQAHNALSQEIKNNK